MASQLGRLEMELKKTLVALDNFREFPGAVDHQALALIWENLPDGKYIYVAVRDANGHFYRGRITGIERTGNGFEVLADDSELVPRVEATSMVGVRIQDKK